MTFQRQFFALLLLSVLAGGCAGGGSTGMRVTDSAQQTRPPEPVELLGPGVAYLVHVDDRERLVTIRNGNQLEAGYFVAVARDGRETAALKVLPNRSAGLRIADILEGNPSINNRVKPASPARAAKLANLYRDPGENSL